LIFYLYFLNYNFRDLFIKNLCFFEFQALCAFMAYKRFLIGAGDEFTSAFETDPANVVHQQAYSYSMDNDNEQYSASPFGQPQQGKFGRSSNSLSHLRIVASGFWQAWNNSLAWSINNPPTKRI